MTTTKNYGLGGVAQTVQLGKHGSTLSTEAEKIIS